MTTVVHLFGSLDPGGAEMRTLEELRARDLTDEHHVFLALSGRPGALEADFAALGCSVVHQRLSWRFPMWFIRYLRSTGATHVHSHVHLASAYLLSLALVARVPGRIAHFRSVGDGRRLTVTRRVYSFAARALLPLVATDIVAVSRSVCDAVLGESTALGRRCRVVYSRIDPGRFPWPGSPRDGRARMIAVGRVDADKNPMRGVAIVAELARRAVLDDVSLTFVGRGDPAILDQVRSEAARLGVSDRVHVLGQRDDVPQLLAASDVLLSTTRREGLPGAIIESSAAGIPAVVSAIAPNGEAARHLPGITLVALDAGDDAWCVAIESAVSARHNRLDAQVIRSSFDRSPFALRGPHHELDRLWR